MMKKKYYDNKIFVIIIQVVTVGLISFSKLELVLKLMLLFAYVMLFRQIKWHKHLLIMLVMITLLFSSTYIYM
jgi:hypothetical protein